MARSTGPGRHSRVALGAASLSQDSGPTSPRQVSLPLPPPPSRSPLPRPELLSWRPFPGFPPQDLGPVRSCSPGGTF